MIALALLAVVFGLTSPSSQSPGAPLAEHREARRTDATYLDLVRMYRVGDDAAAVETVLGWTAGKVEATVGTFLRTLRTDIPGVRPSPPEPGLVAAAIMLHTDTALAALRAGARPADDTPFRHLDAARRLTDALAGPETSSAPASVESTPRAFDAQAWYLAVMRVLIGFERFQDAARMAGPALVRFPDSADLWVAAGTAAETEARRKDLELAAERRPSTGSDLYVLLMRKRTVVDTLRDKAATHYRRALALDPRQLEAHVRLGFIALQRGSYDAASSECRAVPADTQDAYVSYLAHLCLGRVWEQQAEFQRAADAYRAAARIEPSCQACRVALANVLDQLGDEAAAREAFRPVLESVGEKPDAGDGWWVYPWGHLELGEHVVDRLRRQAQSK